jgi:hypothetical protein
VIQGGYADTQDYLRALITADTDDASEVAGPPHLTFDTKAALEALLLEGMQSGDSKPITSSDWQAKRSALADKHTKSGSR